MHYIANILTLALCEHMHRHHANTELICVFSLVRMDRFVLVCVL